MSFLNDSFTSSFLIWMPFISSSYMITVVRTSSTMWNNSGEGRHTCVVPDLKGNTFSFCSLSTMLAIGFSYVAFFMLRYDSFIHPLLRVFNIGTEFYQMPFLHLFILSCDFYLSFSYMMYHIY
uniref:Uncharacterized protein n=1 Tax=Molossus molossus TaxID=27622 RepID=A0A7J8HH49_MOLMO|nr:hypothetical protein HJG59_010986 [Molossus molossus]